MTIRPLEAEDVPKLREIYAEMDFDYAFPDLLSSQFVNVMVLEDGGELVMAVASRKTVENYLWMKKGWKTPGWRQEAFLQLHLAAHKALKAMGFTDCHAWLPPQVAKSFGRRLQRVFGWQKSVWDVFSREL
jgi:hypothetical protein